MWGLLIILSGSLMPLPITWHTTHDACQRQAEVEAIHAAISRREVHHIECRSYVTPRAGAVNRAEVLR